MHSSRAARSGRGPRAALALAPALVLALTACGNGTTNLEPVDGATAGPAGISTSRPATPEPDSSSSSNTTKTDAGPADGTEGCPKGGDKVPVKAGAATVGDLDGDGAQDKVWLAARRDERLLGVTTATGASFSTTFESDSPQAATAAANRLGDGSAVILLRTGTVAALYAVVDCEIVPTENIDGEQYTFDLMGSYGTGVACPMAKDRLYLAGYQTTKAKPEGYANIVRTRIDLSKNGTRAANGTVAELGSHGNDSAAYRIAHGVGCGDSGTAEEPPR